MKTRIVVTIAGILLASTVWAQWYIHTIDDAGTAGTVQNVLVNDPDGKQYCFYWNSTAGKANCAEWTGTDWLITPVLPSNAGWVAGTLDSAGDPYMCASFEWFDGYMTYNNYVLYAVRHSGSWSVDTVVHNYAASSRPYRYTCLAVTDMPHVVTYDSLKCQLLHAWLDPDTTEWQSEVIGDSIRGTSLAADAAGKLYIAYYKSQNLYLLMLDGQQRITYDVDTDGDVGGYPSVSVNSDGSIGISYYDATNGDLKYAVGTPSLSGKRGMGTNRK